MRTLIAVVLSTTLLASAALAGEAGPLAPGKPAGVKQAEMTSTTWVLVGAGVLTAVAVGIASGSNGHPDRGQTSLAVTTTTI
jgi:hypothetical protein